jgi:hypothetical protein
MAAEARRRGAGHVRQLVIPGDGAPWIWNLATRHFPEATAAAARAFPLTGIKADERDKAPGYFETNAHRMRYQHFRSPGMFDRLREC